MDPLAYAVLLLLRPLKATVVWEKQLLIICTDPRDQERNLRMCTIDLSSPSLTSNLHRPGYDRLPARYLQLCAMCGVRGSQGWIDGGASHPRHSCSADNYQTSAGGSQLSRDLHKPNYTFIVTLNPQLGRRTPARLVQVTGSSPAQMPPALHAPMVGLNALKTHTTSTIRNIFEQRHQTFPMKLETVAARTSPTDAALIAASIGGPFHRHSGQRILTNNKRP